MTTKRKQETFIRGTAAHRRTESDYMGALLETVTLDDWRDVVAGALQAAKGGDPAARAWLGQYLVGKPETKAPSALTVVVQQWSGGDPVAEKLAKPILDRALYPSMHENDEWKEGVKSAIAAELAQKLPMQAVDVLQLPK
ncbi:MAG TPA: hypothetical protein PLW86_19120 [Rhodocyclaceae bacterium]|nr:hypothetical protein [Rhodocyclaceae bacterium]